MHSQGRAGPGWAHGLSRARLGPRRGSGRAAARPGQRRSPGWARAAEAGAANSGLAVRVLVLAGEALPHRLREPYAAQSVTDKAAFCVGY
jgi:hypothetical protein